MHMTDEGYVAMAEQLVKLISNPTQLFVGEKREREEYAGPAEVGGWRRKTHEWLLNMVAGTGAKKDNRYVKDNRHAKDNRYVQDNCYGNTGGAAGSGGATVRMGYGSGRTFYKN